MALLQKVLQVSELNNHYVRDHSQSTPSLFQLEKKSLNIYKVAESNHARKRLVKEFISLAHKIREDGLIEISQSSY